MMHQICLYNFSNQAALTSHHGGVFVLNTCQRNLAFGKIEHVKQWKSCHILPINATYYEGPQAYRFLLEVVLGLQSELVAETEISGQFKQSLNLFRESSHRDTKVLRILEKVLKDAKEIRTKYLKEIGQKTYSGIIRRWLKVHAPAKVLIIGSGKMAIDIICQLKEKMPLAICARNNEKVLQLALEHNLEIVPFENLQECSKVAYIINTVGVKDTILLDDHFFQRWIKQNGQQRLFIDLGSPSSICTSLTSEDKVLHFNQVLSEGQKREKVQLEKIALAQKEIHQVVGKRIVTFSEENITVMKEPLFAY